MKFIDNALVLETKGERRLITAMLGKLTTDTIEHFSPTSVGATFEAYQDLCNTLDTVEQDKHTLQGSLVLAKQDDSRA